VTNTSTTTWSAGQVDLRARWLAPSGSDAASAVVEGPTVALGSDLAPGQARTLRALVPPPALADGVSRADYRLRFDLHDSVGNAFFTEKGNPPLDTAPALTRSWPYGDGGALPWGLLAGDSRGDARGEEGGDLEPIPSGEWKFAGSERKYAQAHSF
jgi:hypothetical protein